MNIEKTPRQKAIIKRRIFLACCAMAAVLIILIIALTIKAIKGGKTDNNKSEIISSDTISKTSSDELSSNASSDQEESKPEYVQRGDLKLDANYTNLLLVNNQSPLPESYDYTGNLKTLPDKYLNGSLKEIDANIYDYITAMVDAAWGDGVKLYVRSPYRSYDTQNMLFQNQVQRAIKNGTPEAQAEATAATIVARPGTSEHHTGLAADFNIAEDSFENTPMFAWMQQNAADYGFILRYPKDKTDITGVIYEPWHYRFVGINTAKEMNKLGMCLEEYVEYKAKEK